MVESKAATDAESGAQKPARRTVRQLVFRWLRYAMVLFLVAIAATAYAATREFAREIVSGPNTGKTVSLSEEPVAELASIGVDRELRIDVGPPTASLSVWIMEPTRRPIGTILFLHGHNANKWSMLGPGKALAAAGFRSVLVDLRAHGRSTGQYLTYGILESRDLTQLIDSLIARGVIEGPIGVYGRSYGGAVAIELSAADPRVQAVVAISAFSSVRDVIPQFGHNVLSPVSWFFLRATIPAAINRAGRVGGFDPDQASPLRAIVKTKAPILLIHGRADTWVPCGQSEKMHAAAPDHTRLILVDGANHGFDRKGDAAKTVTDEAAEWFKAAFERPMSPLVSPERVTQLVGSPSVARHN